VQLICCAALGTPPRVGGNAVANVGVAPLLRAQLSIADERRFENGPTLRRFLLCRKGKGS